MHVVVVLVSSGGRNTHSFCSRSTKTAVEIFHYSRSLTKIKAGWRTLVSSLIKTLVINMLFQPEWRKKGHKAAC